MNTYFDGDELIEIHKTLTEIFNEEDMEKKQSVYPQFERTGDAYTLKITDFATLELKFEDFHGHKGRDTAILIGDTRMKVSSYFCESTELDEATDAILTITAEDYCSPLLRMEFKLFASDCY